MRQWNKAVIALVLALSAAPVAAQTSDGVEGSCNFNNSNSCNIALTGVTATSAIIVSSTSTGTQTSISASDGTNTYANALVTGSGPYAGSIVACNVASGNPTITVTVGGTVFGTARAKEVIDAASAGCLEARVTNQQASVGTGTNAITSGAIGTPASSGAYIYGVTSMNCCAAPTLSAGTGFTADITGNDSGARSMSEYLIQGSPASVAATFTTSLASSTFVTHGIIIKAASGGGAPARNFFNKRRTQ